jgi:hypothetical protein
VTRRPPAAEGGAQAEVCSAVRSSLPRRGVIETNRQSSTLSMMRVCGWVLVVDPWTRRGWVTIVLEDGEGWSTLDGEVFYAHGRAVRVGDGATAST